MSPPHISSWVTGTTVPDFQIQDGHLCHLGHLYFPTSEHANIIWEAHYSQVAGHFVIDKAVVIRQDLLMTYG
jgi:hypothetical protein